MLSEEEILSSYPWLTKDLFTDIIREDQKDASIKVTDFIAKGALAPGENYASIMIRAAVNYVAKEKTSKKCFIIKAAHNKKDIRDMLNAMNLFEKEITMYRDILPKVEQMLADIGDNSKLSPKCYKVSDIEDEQYLIFEDLTSRGYKNADRRLGLNIAHYKKCLSKIAKWHAAMAVLLETTNYKDFPRILDYPCIYKTEQLKEMTINIARAASELTQTMPGYEHLSEKLIDAVPKIFSKTNEILGNENGSFFTLCHGDLWMNNILFSYDENGEPSDAILVDYQAPFRGPAIMDVINNLYSSSEEGLEEREWDILIQHYHKERSETLKQLGYDKAIPSLNRTQIEFLEKGCVIAIATLLYTGTRLLENTGEDVTIFLGEGEECHKMKMKIMSNPKARKALEFFLNFFDKKGYFE